MGKKNIGWWIAGILYLIISIGTFITSFFGGILMAAGGIFVLPPFSKWLDDKYHIKISTWIKIIVLIVVIGISMSIDSTALDDKNNCTSDWQCTSWSDCLSAENQSRSCEDLNKCGTIEDRPSIFRNCLKETIESKTTSEYSDDTWESLLEIKLISYGLDVENIETVDGRNNGGTKTVLISYKSVVTTEVDLAKEIGWITGSFLGATREGWDVDELSVIIGDVYGNAVAMWFISKEWKDDYLNGKITTEEVGLNAIGSIGTF